MIEAKNNLLDDPLYAIHIMTEVTKALLFLHSNDVIHRDVKSENIMVGGEDLSIIKIGDFYTARILETSAMMTMSAGTVAWCAPEIFNCSNHTTACDTYSFAVLMWEVVERRGPFESIKAWSVPQLVMKGARPAITADLWPDPLLKLVKRCWDQNPKKRPNFKQVYDELLKMEKKMHHFIAKQQDKVSPIAQIGTLHSRRARLARTTASRDILTHPGSFHGRPEDEIRQ